MRKSVSKCHRSSLFPTFSFSLINKTHGRCQESRLFHSQRFCFGFLFTPKRCRLETRVSYLTTKQNLFFSKMRPECFRQRDAGDGLSSAKCFVTSAGRTHYSLSQPADSRYGGYPSPKVLSFDHCSTKALSATTKTVSPRSVHLARRCCSEHNRADITP